MASNGESVSADHVFDLVDLYQQLKEVDLMLRSTKSHIGRTKGARKYAESMANNAPEGSFNLLPPWALDVQLESLNDFQKSLDGFQSSLRRTVGIVSRSKLRPLHILDMPDEILVKIFGHVKGGSPNSESYFSEFDYGVGQIKNSRLTCRRFHDTSSHLLLHFIDVELNPASFLRLEEISRHPIISKGIRTVRVLPRFYYSALANDIDNFANYNGTKLDELTSHLENQASWEAEQDEKLVGFPFLDKETVGSIPKLRTIVDSWAAFADQLGEPNDTTSGEYLGNWIMLTRAHDEYRRRFAEQETLREKGALTTAVSSAFARMPTANRLIFQGTDAMSDKKWSSRPSYSDIASEEDALVRYIVLPVHWEEARIWDFGGLEVDLLVKLPLAIHKAGVLLTSINIEISPPEDLTTLEISDEDDQALAAATRNLKYFRFATHVRKKPAYWPPREASEIEHLGRFLSAVIKSDHLTDIDIDVSFTWDRRSQPCLDLRTITSIRKRPKLYILSLNGAYIHISELERIVNQMSQSIKLFWLKNIYLVGGTWAEALDILRKRSGIIWSLDNLLGAECERLSAEEKETIFGTWTGTDMRENLVSAYVSGDIEQNPFRKHEQMDEAQ